MPPASCTAAALGVGSQRRLGRLEARARAGKDVRHAAGEPASPSRQAIPRLLLCGSDSLLPVLRLPRVVGAHLLLALALALALAPPPLPLSPSLPLLAALAEASAKPTATTSVGHVYLCAGGWHGRAQSRGDLTPTADGGYSAWQAVCTARADALLARGVWGGTAPRSPCRSAPEGVLSAKPVAERFF